MARTQQEYQVSNLKKRTLVVVASFAVVGVVESVILGGCPSGEAPGPNEVFMRSIAFDPPEITIQAGESVTWTNMDFVPHTATSGNPGDADFGSVFQSARLSSGETFIHTFDEPGEFIYFCEVHPNMMRDAKVIVQE